MSADDQALTRAVADARLAYDEASDARDRAYAAYCEAGQVVAAAAKTLQDAQADLVAAVMERSGGVPDEGAGA